MRMVVYYRIDRIKCNEYKLQLRNERWQIKIIFILRENLKSIFINISVWNTFSFYKFLLVTRYLSKMKEIFKGAQILNICAWVINGFSESDHLTVSPIILISSIVCIMISNKARISFIGRISTLLTFLRLKLHIIIL